MEQEPVDNDGLLKLLDDSDERPRTAVNSVVLDYYRKFGRKRDLEQYFSLSTAQSDISDPRSLFWRRMKEQSDTSDSGEKKSESSNEICRISIKCSIPERSETEKRASLSNNDSESPPIITDVLPVPSHSDDESVDDNHSQKSAEGTLDTSTNKPLSPTSSITSQRKLEWDSLADVGYGNESDRKTSASSLSTLEREVLAQKQQYTLDYKPNSNLGVPTAHSTPVDANEGKSKGKKGQGKKTISISRKDVDFVEVSVPQNVENAQPINVNLTKQFSVNLLQDGGLTVDNVKKDITITPEKIADAELNAEVKIDKEIQTSLLRPEKRDQRSCLQEASTSPQKIPILISLNTLRRRQRRKKSRKPRKKLKITKKQVTRKEIIHEKDKSGEQVSEAESFEYMPGHIYNQNQLKHDPNRSSNNNNNNVGNKSSLESSAAHTTDSSRESKYSFSKDLDKTLNVLKSSLKEKYDGKLKKKLITEIIQRLLKSNYGEGERTPDFLSVLSLASKKTPTTSTSEADNMEEKVVHPKPKKSILRVNKFDPNNVASTSQSAPNLPSVVNSDKPVMSYLSKVPSSTTTETDLSNNSAKDGTSSDTVFAKTSSEELYKKYIDALKREEAYKQHLKDKELFLRQKLVRSENALKVPMQFDERTNNKLKELIKDLTRNNYDDGSGDASKLEGGSGSNVNINIHRVPRKHRSHSVFTLSSGNSDVPNRSCLKNKLQREMVNSPRAGPSRNLTGSCNKPAVTDSSVQVNINVHDKPSTYSPNLVEEDEYACSCTEKAQTCHRNRDEVVVYKCPIQDPMQITKSKICTIKQPVCSIHPSGSSVKGDMSTNSHSTQPKKQETVECTKCLQTKISILPKLSDPSVSDINIIDSADCVKLITELYKKVSQTSLECPCSKGKEDSSSNTCKSSKDYIRQHRDEQDNFIEEGQQMAPLIDQRIAGQSVIQTCIGCQKTFTNQPESISDNIVIPIQGTNMMLKVSIGGDKMMTEDKQYSKGTLERNTLDRKMATDEIKTSIKGTSILAECSKYVQANNACDINENTTAPSHSKKNISPRETAICGDNTAKEIDYRKNKELYTSDAICTFGSNTYPKTVQIIDKKPLFRSNTDTGNLGADSAIQTDAIYNKDKETQPCFRVEMKEDFLRGNHSRSKGNCEIQPQAMLKSSATGSSNYSSGERFQTLDAFKTKNSAERQKSKEEKSYETITDEGKPKDLILDVIKDITKRYSKRDIDKRNKKKCFKEIMAALSDLLDTDDSGDGDQEFSKKSQRSKAVQHSKGQSTQSEESSKFIKPPKNTKEFVVKNMKVQSLDRNRTQNPCSRKNSVDANSDIVLTRSDRTELKSTCDKGCGCDGSSECKDCIEPSANFESGSCSKSLRSQKHETRDLNQETYEKQCICGCGSANCKDCVVPHSTASETGSCGKEFSRSEEHETSSALKLETSTAGELESGSSDQESCRYKKQEATSKIKNKTSCINECGCDGSSECKDCAARQSEKTDTVTCGKKSTKYESSRRLPNKTKPTCDMGCGCDGSTDCKNCEGPQSPKFGTGKELAKPKRRDTRSDSPKKTKTTCDKGCGCDGTEECGDCMGPPSPKNKSSRCGNNAIKSTKKEGRCNSPTKPKTTCDKGCGCDGTKECRNCVGPHSPKNKLSRCGQSIKPAKQGSRCNSPVKSKTTCDRGCGSDSPQCKECDHKTGRCGKNNSSCKKEVSANSMKFVNRYMQSTVKRVKSLYSHCDDSSDLPVSTDPPCCSTDSPTTKLVNKIKKECEKYQKRCKSCCKKCDASSSSAVSCDHCKRHHHCRWHKCRCHKTRSMERTKKKCVAYNLIVQTSDSMISEDTVFDRCRPLQNVIVRVPKCKANVPFKEACTKIEQKLPYCSYEPKGRSQSWPNECGISSTDDVKMAKQCTVREYLEKNRPDFVDRCATRQNCIKMISEARSRERSELREQMVGLESLPSLTDEELIYLAKELGLGRRRPSQQKIMSEREMKKHSEKIYKSLPEVVQKKEEARKESIKKTNLLMANIFKKVRSKMGLKSKSENRLPSYT